MALKQQNKIKMDFQMASLTDIIFLLLIFFMLSSSVVAPNAIKVMLPNSSGQTVASQSINVTVTADQQYFLNNKKISFDQISAGLAKLLKDQKDPTVVLSADKSLPYETVVQLMSIVKEFDCRMILATKPSGN
jgi:biopolymer transport protein ExbD